MHIRRCALQHAATSSGEQRVTAEQHRADGWIVGLVDVEGDVSPGVGRYIDHLDRCFDHRQTIAALYGDRLKGNAIPVLA